MKKIIINTIPWLITVTALYFLLKDINWSEFQASISKADGLWLSLGVLLTFLSYIVRAYRWQFFFEKKGVLSYFSSLKVLFLGFFMNNILPARAGELVRAHAGARVAGTKRTLVLATIASERLVDGLTISAFFLCCGFKLASDEISSKLFYVAVAFALVALSVVATLTLRERIFFFAECIARHFHNTISDYAQNRLQVFINGLTPLCKRQTLIPVIIWSLAIWSLELSVYIVISKAFGVILSPAQCVLFMVAVNFSSLIPAAPAGFGVIEVAAVAVLMSLQFYPEMPPDVKHATALSMVLSQHMIQFFVVGIFGLGSLLLLRKQIGTLRSLKDDPES